MRTAQIGPDLRLPLGKSKTLIDEYVRENILPKAWVALGKFLEKFVYLAVEICHQETLPSATPSFPVGKKICETEKHQRYRSAWVGQADFGKLELNNRNHSGNCQCLSVKRKQSETRSV